MKLRNVIFYVKGIEAAKDFYKSLGFEIKQDFGKFVSYDVEIEKQYFSIMESDDVKKVPGKQVCTFWADDIDRLYKSIRNSTIKVDTELYEAPFGKTFAIRDIDGNKIEFVQLEAE